MKLSMQKNRFKGFTLIELLVVIAIIGILSAVVLASLTTARSKGNDAAIQSDLNTIQTQAEIYYDSNSSSYNSTNATISACSGTGTMFDSTNKTISNALQGIANNGGSATCSISSDGSAYAVEVQSVSNTANYFCIDSTGVSEKTTGTITSASACP